MLRGLSKAVHATALLIRDFPANHRKDTAPQHTTIACKHMHICLLIKNFLVSHHHGIIITCRSYRLSAKLCQCSCVERVLWGGDHHTCLSGTALVTHHHIQHGLDSLTGSVHQVDVLVAARYTISLRDELSYVFSDDLNATRLRVGTYTMCTCTLTITMDIMCTSIL